MKLRNKKTGDIIVGKCFTDIIEVLGKRGDLIVRPTLLNLDLFTKYWEEICDYPPTEPLIKDEKIRKAVRAWAEACNLKHVTYKQASNEFYDADTRGAFAIRFTLMPVEVYLEDGECYTITELCGEEEG